MTETVEIPLVERVEGANEEAREWRCFHCDALFLTEHAARIHFGPDEGFKPACQIKAAEGGLLRALREAEEDAQQARWDLHAESADGLKAYRGNLSRHHAALRAVEEAGYERGLADGRDLDPMEDLHNRMFAAGVSQRELAKRLGVTEARISQMLADDANPTIETVRKVRVALKSLTQGEEK